MSESPEQQADSPASERDELQAELADLNDNDEGGADLSDDESVLSEVDEAQFEDFNPDDVAIEDRPALDVDAENLKLIGRHKRKRRDDEEGGEPRRTREGRREKKKKRAQGGSDVESGDGKTVRRKSAKPRREARTQHVRRSSG